MNDNFIAADAALRELADSFDIPEGEFFDSFTEEFGTSYSVKVFKRRYVFFEAERVWYNVQIIGPALRIDRVAEEEVNDWYFEVNARRVPDLAEDLESVEGVGDVIGAAVFIGTNPNSVKIDMVRWLNDFRDELEG